jgi:hypothetical protein
VSLVCEKGFSITQDEAVKFIKEADERKPPVPTAYQTTQTPTPYSDGRHESEKKTGKLALIVGLAKAGKNENQIQAEIKSQYGPLNNHMMYIIGREWRRVNECLRQRGARKFNSELQKDLGEKGADTPQADYPISSKKKVGKMAFVEALLTAKGESRKTKSEIVKLFMEEFPNVSEKTAKNTVTWSASTLKRRTGKESNHLPNMR